MVASAREIYWNFMARWTPEDYSRLAVIESGHVLPECWFVQAVRDATAKNGMALVGAAAAMSREPTWSNGGLYSSEIQRYSASFLSPTGSQLSARGPRWEYVAGEIASAR